MINVGKCPKCQSIISNVKTEDITMDVGFHPTWNGFSHLCPRCNTIISVEINPLLIKDDIVNELMDRLRKGR